MLDVGTSASPTGERSPTERMKQKNGEGLKIPGFKI